MGCIVGRSQVADESGHGNSGGQIAQTGKRNRCACISDATKALQKLKARFMKMHENLQNMHQASSRDVDGGFHELQPPDAVKKLAKNHARFLVSLHHISNSANVGKVDANEKEKEAQIPQLLEKSWPMYFVDNIRIRKICDVSILVGAIHLIPGMTRSSRRFSRLKARPATHGSQC
jgi:hypothetical protein